MVSNRKSGQTLGVEKRIEEGQLIYQVPFKDDWVSRVYPHLQLPSLKKAKVLHMDGLTTYKEDLREEALIYSKRELREGELAPLFLALLDLYSSLELYLLEAEDITLPVECLVWKPEEEALEATLFPIPSQESAKSQLSLLLIQLPFQMEDGKTFDFLRRLITKEGELSRKREELLEFIQPRRDAKEEDREDPKKDFFEIKEPKSFWGRLRSLFEEEDREYLEKEIR